MAEPVVITPVNQSDYNKHRRRLLLQLVGLSIGKKELDKLDKQARAILAEDGIIDPSTKS